MNSWARISKMSKETSFNKMIRLHRCRHKFKRGALRLKCLRNKMSLHKSRSKNWKKGGRQLWKKSNNFTKSSQRKRLHQHLKLRQRKVRITFMLIPHLPARLWGQSRKILNWCTKNWWRYYLEQRTQIWFRETS